MVFNDASKDKDTKNVKNARESGVRNAERSGRGGTESNAVCTLPCEIVRDLLPSYAEGLASDVTEKAIKHHLEDCSACLEVLAAMQADDKDVAGAISDTISESEVLESETGEIDYLKKVRRRFITGITICIAAAIIALCGLWTVQYRFNTFSMQTTDIESAANSVSVENTTLEFSGKI